MSAHLYVYDYIPVTEVEGPGKRFSIWLQGCSIRCEGCMAKHTWEPEAGEKMSVNDLINLILSTKEIEGVTILGGEPMDQSKALLMLLKEIKQTGLSVLLFTGYLMEQLMKDPEKEAVLKLCDIVIDGPYLKNQTDFSRPLAGSANQRIFFLSDRYHELTEPNKVEIRMTRQGKITVNGMLPETLLNELLSDFNRPSE